jgi:DNA primase
MEAHPSLRMSTVDGHFFCHACGIKGGDIVALHMIITGLGFMQAVQALAGRFYGK